MYMRLNKFLANSGIASRRSSDELIKNGQVKVNGHVITEMGVKIDPAEDKVEVNGKIIKTESKNVVYLLNKPRGVITTVSDPEHRKTVMDFVPAEPRVFPCGRLDENTMGLVVLTNDGNLCYQLTHPKFEHKKEYFVEGIAKNIEAAKGRLDRPIKLKDGPATIDGLRFVKEEGNKLNFFITIHDGRNRIVRRICDYCKIEVKNLTRTKLGHYELAGIEPGKYKEV